MSASSSPYQIFGKKVERLLENNTNHLIHPVSLWIRSVRKNSSHDSISHTSPMSQFTVARNTLPVSFMTAKGDKKSGLRRDFLYLHSISHCHLVHMFTGTAVPLPMGVEIGSSIRVINSVGCIYRPEPIHKFGTLAWTWTWRVQENDLGITRKSIESTWSSKVERLILCALYGRLFGRLFFDTQTWLS